MFTFTFVLTHKMKIAIIGYGKIGKAVRKRAAGFDMKVIVYSPNEAKHIKKRSLTHKSKTFFNINFRFYLRAWKRINGERNLF